MSSRCETRSRNITWSQNEDGGCRFELDIYWTPWVGELARPESPLAQAVGRLAARGWQHATD